jgi:putative glycosyltransferase (TIGR04372 family)
VSEQHFSADEMSSKNVSSFADRQVILLGEKLVRYFQTSRSRHFIRNILFTCLPFKMRFWLTMWFRHSFNSAGLDRHFAFFCGPFLNHYLRWIARNAASKKYANEVVFYLLSNGFRKEALSALIEQAAAEGRDTRKVASALVRSIERDTGTFDQGHSMDILTQAHRVDWRYAADQSARLRNLVRLMLEHRNFQHQERMFRELSDLSDLPPDAPVDKYIPYLFEDDALANHLINELGLTPATENCAAGEQGAHKTAKTKLLDLNVSLLIYFFYAYRHLLLRTYHNGEGNLVPIVYSRCMDTQRRLRPSLPAPSSELKCVLDDIGVELGDVRLLSPDWSALIGHNGHLNVHLMMREMKWWKGSPILLAYKDRIANKPFLSLFSEICPTLILGEDVTASAWYELASLTPFLGDSHQAFEFKDGRVVYWNDAGSLALKQWERDGKGFPLRDIYDRRLLLNDRTEGLYQSLRRKWGMGPSDWYVCLHMRDAEARGETIGVGESVRSATMDNYLASVRHITAMGGWVIRMGGRKAPPMPKMARVVDYARSPDQVPEMDIHLMRRARMFIGTTSGFAYVATSFGIPTAMVNALSSIGLLWSTDTRFALKPVHTREGRMLSLNDVTSERWRWTFPTYETLRSAGLTVSESSADEILETTKEVLDLSSGSARTMQSVDGSWERQLNIPGFFGASRPSRYFLEKYSKSLFDS